MCVSSRKKTGVEASVMSGFGALLEGERRQGFDVMLQSWAGEQVTTEIFNSVTVLARISDENTIFCTS